MSKKILLCGSNGYIGFSLLNRLLSEGYTVFGVDSDKREDAVLELNSISATNSSFKTFEHPNFSFKKMDVARDFSELDSIIREFAPDAIVNLAHIPSAPYSQIDWSHANFTLTNNFNGTNNILWSMKNNVPNCHYITIGTAGEYNHYANVDIEEGYFVFEHNGRESKESIYPRRPGSIYHTTKVASTYLIDLLNRSWKIKATDVMQGIVFGLYTDEFDQSGLSTRLDSDECFGTVLNRFCVQALLGEPLTVYGNGNHKRAFISLNDSVQALMLAIENEPKTNRVRVWNQLSEWHSMNDLAAMVIEEASKIGVESTSVNIPTPRAESTDDHYYNFITKNLTDLGYSPTRNIREEIRYVLGKLQNELTDEKKEILKNVVTPKIKWDF